MLGETTFIKINPASSFEKKIIDKLMIILIISSNQKYFNKFIEGLGNFKYFTVIKNNQNLTKYFVFLFSE